MQVEYYDRSAEKMVVIDLPADVIAVRIPAQNEGEWEPLPAITVNVNTDAVIVDRTSGEPLGSLNYIELLAEAESEGLV